LIFGVFRHHGGRITELNRWRLPVSGSTRRSPDPREAHLDRTSPGQDLAGFVVTVAHHQPPTVLVALAGEPDDALLDLGLQCLGQHPPGALTHDVIDHRRRLGITQLHTAGAGIISCGLGGYGKHGSYLPDQRCTAGLA
jgi:hypothetical protein